ncbi:ribonuclease H2 subunit A isoform X1 [Diabrotica undecimpunctata]|uniref:ribonuclease H2 subunit A isoform X1 n=1 Tax=Diabrotica undecimpunctata TaxID=50387 RepID=UPI003B63495A
MELEKIASLETLKTFISEKDNSQNIVYISDIPDVCKEYPCILGIDEAGRGPVLGPMVYGICFCPINEQMILEKLECADSKALTEEKRDNIFSNICKESKVVGWAVEIISPNSICNNMLSRTKYSLNQVSMDSAVGLVRAAEKAGVKIEHIFVDTVGPPEKYEEYLKRLFPKYKVKVSKKADSLYPIVSAASICAKVTRDHALKVWTFQEGLDVTHEQFGSGYPGGNLLILRGLRVLIEGDPETHRPLEYKEIQQQASCSSTPAQPLISTKYDDISFNDSDSDNEEMLKVSISELNGTIHEGENLNSSTDYDSIEKKVESSDNEMKKLLTEFVRVNEKCLNEYRPTICYNEKTG